MVFQLEGIGGYSLFYCGFYFDKSLCSFKTPRAGFFMWVQTVNEDSCGMLTEQSSFHFVKIILGQIMYFFCLEHLCEKYKLNLCDF